MSKIDYKFLEETYNRCVEPLNECQHPKSTISKGDDGVVKVHCPDCGFLGFGSPEAFDYISERYSELNTSDPINKRATDDHRPARP